MRLNSDDIAFDPKAVTDIRLDRIGASGDGLWWVAVGFADGSTKPEGMFTSRAEAEGLANDLAGAWHVNVKVKLDL